MVFSLLSYPFAKSRYKKGPMATILNDKIFLVFFYSVSDFAEINMDKSKGKFL